MGFNLFFLTLVFSATALPASPLIKNETEIYIVFQADSFFRVPFEEVDDVTGHDTSGIELITFTGPLGDTAATASSTVAPGPEDVATNLSASQQDGDKADCFACAAEVHRSAEDPPPESESCL